MYGMTLREGVGIVSGCWIAVSEMDESGPPAEQPASQPSRLRGPAVRMSKPKLWLSGLIAVAVLVGGTALLLQRGNEDPGTQEFGGLDPMRFVYQEELRTTLGEARRGARFRFPVPDHPAANLENLVAVYM